MYLANITIIQQHQNVVIYSNFKPALLLDIIELSKLQIFKIGVVQTAQSFEMQNDKTIWNYILSAFNHSLIRIIAEPFPLSPLGLFFQ
jgi:hypothetical protein